MTVISPEYLKIQEELHSRITHYGSSGHRHSNEIYKIAQSLNTTNVLDYGCGKNTLAMTLPFPINKYDPAIIEYASDPNPAEFVVCTDVLEHIEPELLDDVLKHMQELTLQFGFFVICLVPAQKTLSDGRNAHLILQPYTWWLMKIEEYFDVSRMERLNPYEVILYTERKK